MNVSIGDRWESFVEAMVKDGRYNSASEIVREGLRLVEEREAKLQSLRDMLSTSIANGKHVTREETDAALAKRRAELIAKGVAE